MMVPIAPETVPQRMEVAFGPAAAAKPVSALLFIDAAADADADTAILA